MPHDVLRACLREERRVWPVLGAALDDDKPRTLPSEIFADLGSVLITVEEDEERISGALAIAGVSITSVPEYIFLELGKVECQTMTPASVHQFFRVSRLILWRSTSLRAAYENQPVE